MIQQLLQDLLEEVFRDAIPGFEVSKAAACPTVLNVFDFDTTAYFAAAASGYHIGAECRPCTAPVDANVQPYTISSNEPASRRQRGSEHSLLS